MVANMARSALLVGGTVKSRIASHVCQPRRLRTSACPGMAEVEARELVSLDRGRRIVGRHLRLQSGLSDGGAVRPLPGARRHGVGRMETRAGHGLVLGKFMPLTNGHRHLIDTARRQVDELTILVCSLARDPIDGDRRYRWVRECYPDARVVHITDELPSYPHEHPDFWALWRACIARVALPIDVVFTSEDYGDRLAAELGARHVLVDAARQIVPISATRVRAAPLACWEYLPPCVRPYYVKRVLLV